MVEEQKTDFQRENQRISANEILEAIAKGCSIRLDRCTVSGELDINRLLVKEESFDTSGITVEASDTTTTITLPQLFSFSSCTFEEAVFFAPPWDQADSVKVIFKRDAAFNSSIFCGTTRFANALFHGLAGFDGCTFGRAACFRNAVFQGRAMFRTVGFEGYGLFNNAQFRKEVRFTNTSFSKGANYSAVMFTGRCDFAGVYSKSKSVPIYEDVKFARSSYGDDESFWRYIKQVAQDAGHYQLAGEGFYNERCAHFWNRLRGPHYDELTPGRKFGRIILGARLLPELILGRMLFGYGERPVRVLIAGMIVILVCGMFYASPYAAVAYRADTETLQLSMMDGLYFSTITFTTLGFGDMYPDRGNLLTRGVAMAEAISGASLMALFVVSLSKRYSRG